MSPRRTFALGFVAGVSSILAAFAVWALVAMVRLDSQHEARASAIRAETMPILEPPPLPAMPRPADQRPALERWTLAEVTGGEMLRLPGVDGKTRVVTQWATWCAPCQAEMPSLESLSETLAPGIELFLFSTEDSGAIESYLRRHPTGLRIFRSANGVPASIWSPGPPITHVIDCRGRVTYSHLGAADWGRSEVRRFLADLHETCTKEWARASVGPANREPTGNLAHGARSGLAQQSRDSAS